MAWDWENNGSCQDLSALAAGSLRAGSMSGGNTITDNTAAMTAPGSPSETTQPSPSGDYGDPTPRTTGPEVPASELPPGDDGKPRASAGTVHQPRPAWNRTTRPDVVRTTQGGSNG